MSVRSFFVAICTFLVITLSFQGEVRAQNMREIDSMERALKTANDSIKMIIYNYLAHQYRLLGDYDKSIHACEKGLEYSKKVKFKMGIGNSYFNLGLTYWQRQWYSNALIAYDHALEAFKEHGSKRGQSNCYINIGLVYDDLGNFPDALKYYLEALTMKEKLKDKLGISQAANSIGNVYRSLHKKDEALQYFTMSKENCGNDKTCMAKALNNMGLIYMDKGDLNKANELIEQSLALKKEAGIKRDIASSYLNLGQICILKKDYNKAIEYINKGIEQNKEVNDNRGMIQCNNMLGRIYLEKKEYDKSEKHLKEGLREGLSAGNKDFIITSYFYLSSLDSARGNYAQSLEYYKKYIQYTDSVDNQEVERKLVQSQMKFDYEKKEALTKAEYDKQQQLAQFELEKQNILLQRNQQNLLLLGKDNELKKLNLEKQRVELLRKTVESENQAKNISILNKDRALKAAEARQKEEALKQQRFVTYMLGAGGLLVLVLLVLAIRGYLQKRKAGNIILSQKKEVEREKLLAEEQRQMAETQRHLVEEKQKEIIDSINYAKHLQQAILATPEDIKKFIPNSFLYYLPKDIVAGDFYFFETTDTYTFIAAADCTGHGVPGAMVSVVCSNALSRCVKEFKLTDPGIILDKTRELVLETFRKSGQVINDGMDISFLAMNRETGQIQWAGANNPLWTIQHNVLHEIFPNKQPVGKTDTMTSFTTHTVKVEKGDLVYLFTDGFADQFGGPKGKKFKASGLRELFMHIKDMEMAAQRNYMKQSFTDWKKNLEQLDDVCVIGIRI